ncbi:Abi family protein [Mariniflexile sp. HMF6888]|uniref:Abi family protein n=1 Tax=Mariniflexile sp. HMF6888 TaxID=3373086 RepID=UPI00378AD0E5
MAKQEVFSKPARNADYLLNQLKERGLVVNEEDELISKQLIRSIGYYRLSGYFGPLQNEKDVFKEGTTFNDILRLYKFDTKLKAIIFQLLEKFEIELRTSITDTLSLSLNSDWYVNPVLFKDDTIEIEVLDCIIDEQNTAQKSYLRVDKKLYDILLNEINNSVVKQKDSAFIKAFYEKHHESCPVPSWMMMESISFGKLSRLFWLLNHSDEKRAIAKRLGALTPDHLSSWLHSFVILRNACAHHGRVWNRKVKDVKIPTRPSKKFITNTDIANLRMLYGVLSCLMQIFEKTDKEEQIRFKTILFKLVEEHDIDFGAMGFPEGWENDNIWKI